MARTSYLVEKYAIFYKKRYLILTRIIFVDFEAASRKAFSNVYKNSNFYGCLFHFHKIFRGKYKNYELFRFIKKKKGFDQALVLYYLLHLFQSIKLSFIFMNWFVEKKEVFYEEMKDILIYFKKKIYTITKNGSQILQCL
jgi:hypothetical protein